MSYPEGFYDVVYSRDAIMDITDKKQLFLFRTKWWSFSVEGLLSTGPTPSSLNSIPSVPHLDCQISPDSSFFSGARLVPLAIFFQVCERLASVSYCWLLKFYPTFEEENYFKHKHTFKFMMQIELKIEPSRF